MAAKITHFEITGKEAGKLREFYSKLFSWNIKVEKMPGGEYGMVDTGGQPGGGICEPLGGDKPNYVMVYVGVDDLDATLASAEKLGGKILQKPIEIPNVVTFAIFQDPAGNVMGITKNMP